MKVAYILNVFPKISETFILNEIIEVQNNDVDVEVFAFSGSGENVVHPQVSDVKKLQYLAPEKKSIGILFDHLYWLVKSPIRYLKTLLIACHRANGITRLFLTNLHNVKCIVDSRPDILHAHFGFRAADMALLVHLLSGIEYTFTTHRGDIFDVSLQNYIIKTRLAKMHITISQFNKDYLINHFGADGKKIMIIHCGIRFAGEVKKNKTADGFNIVAVARLEKMKALDNLILACARLKKQGENYVCRIVGEGGERLMLKEMIDKHDLSQNVLLLGNQTQADVFRLIRESDIMVLPSRSEGIPVSLMEAMMLKTPVISTRITGIPELIEDGLSGYLVEPDNIEALTERIQILMNDKQKRFDFAEKGFSKVQECFNLEVEVRKLINLWQTK